MSREFNYVVCLYNLFPVGTRLFHAMDSSPRYSVVLVCDIMSTMMAISALETVWLAPFWYLNAGKTDQDLKMSQYLAFLAPLVIQFQPTPPCRHFLNLLESKRTEICTIFLRLLAHKTQLFEAHAANRVVRISNDLYISYVISVFELAIGYCRALFGEQRMIPAHVFELHMWRWVKAHTRLLAKCKLVRILRRKAIDNIVL